MRHRLRHAGGLAAALCLLLPAAALAETLTVDPGDGNDTCSRSGADKTCRTITGAIAIAEGGDTIKILKGTYGESFSIPAEKDALKLEGAGLADVKVTGNGTGDVITVAGDDAVVQGLTIEVPVNGGSAALVQGADASLQEVSLARNNTSTNNDPVIDAPGGGELSKAIVVQNAGGAGTPAIRSTGAGFTVVDAVVIGLRGPAAIFSSSLTNRLVRATLVSGEAASNGVELTSVAGSTGNKKLLADSAVIVGGADASALLAKTTGADTGDLTVDLRHVTIAGTAKSITLDAQGANASAITNSDPAGNIAATAVSSIVHGAVTAAEHSAQLLPPTRANTVTFSCDFCDTSATPDPGTGAGKGQITIANSSNTPDAQIFVPGRLALRADAPIIDKGAPPAAEDSATDYEGDPRVTGAASDIGADEYTNRPPVARFGITNTKPRQNEDVGFVSGSIDPEAGYGGGITEFRWNFGDGTRETTGVGAAVHRYASPGTYQVTLQVRDRQGLLSAVTAPQTITVRDGKPVDLKVSAPVAGARITLNLLPKKPRKGSKAKPKIPRALPLRAVGTAADESGVTQVQAALVLVKRSRIPKLLRPAFRKATTAQTKAKTCEHYIGSKGFEKRPCDKVTYFLARRTGADWSFNTSRKFRLPPGSYELHVRATDGSGLVTVPSVKDGTLVKIRIR